MREVEVNTAASSLCCSEFTACRMCQHARRLGIVQIASSTASCRRLTFKCTCSVCADRFVVDEQSTFKRQLQSHMPVRQHVVSYCPLCFAGGHRGSQHQSSMSPCMAMIAALCCIALTADLVQDAPSSGHVKNEPHCLVRRPRLSPCFCQCAGTWHLQCVEAC